MPNNFSSYKLKIASRYVPVDAGQIGLKIAESDHYLASVKHDGHLAFIVVKKGKAQLFDGNGNELKIDAIIKAASAITEDVVLAGELCCFHNDKSTSHREVSAALASPAKFDLRFAAFDLLEHNGESVSTPPKDRLDFLAKITGKAKEVFAIEQHFFESRKDIVAFFNTADEQKAEGIIVKVPAGITYKIKQVHNLDLVVLAYAEAAGEREGLLRELLLGFALGKNQYQIVTKCGVGFSDTARKELPGQLEKITTGSEYTEVSGAKTAFIFVKPEIVVEISCLDLINENTDGAIRKARLTYSTQNGYTYNGNENTLSIISPSFVRIRTDKKASEHEAGTTQAYLITEPMQQVWANDTGKDSEIMLREVFTKEGKGGLAVRKFVGVKTNKEASGLYAPYMVVYSDYSAGRKTPLEQEVFLCASEKEVQEKVASMKEENIKKGWEAHT